MAESNPKAVFSFGKRDIVSVTYLETGGLVKVIIRTKHNTYKAKLFAGKDIYCDSFNIEEPFDRHTHVFYIPKRQFSTYKTLRLTASVLKRVKIHFSRSVSCKNAVFADKDELLKACDNALRLELEEKEDVTDGVTYFHRLYSDKNGLPVHNYTTVFSPSSAKLYVGTPNDGYESVNVRATIPDMIAAAENNGHDIVAAVNADFFDMLGDFHPSGLCVKNSRVIANPESPRYFAALMKDGRHTVTCLGELNGETDRIAHAAAGLQLIVNNGKLSDWAPGEPFGYTRHPRTAVGITKDNSVILTVVDGRIPEHSNGASLVDLANLMIEYGADRAINMDGGGSSAMYIKKDGAFILRNRPADLFRPKAMLIRKDYNAVLVEKIR